jgi:hypothetical protein
VRGGRRYVFIPLKTGVSGRASGSAAFEKHIAAVLGDIPYTLEYPAGGKPLGLYAGIFAAALCVLQALCYALKRPAAQALCLLPCVPVLLSLAFFGASGFFLIAVLLGISALLWEPLRACCTALRLFVTSGGDSAGKRGRLVRDVYEPFKTNWRLSLLFTAAFMGMAVFSGIPLLFALPVLPLFAALCFFSIWIFSGSGDYRRRVRFYPVPIMKRFSPDAGAVPYLLSFVLAALLAAALTPFVRPGAGTGAAFASLAGNQVTEADYRRHVLFQSSFSRLPLSDHLPGGADVVTDGLKAGGQMYPSYELDADGLLRAAPADEAEVSPAAFETPPFPLRDLTRFLNGMNPAADSRHFAPETTAREFLPALPPLLAALAFFMLRRKIFAPGLVRGGGRGLRRGDKKRKKILYSGDRKNYFIQGMHKR